MWIDRKILSYFPDNLLSTDEVEGKFLVQNPAYLSFIHSHRNYWPLYSSPFCTIPTHMSLLPSLGLRGTVPQRSPDSA